MTNFDLNNQRVLVRFLLIRFELYHTTSSVLLKMPDLLDENRVPPREPVGAMLLTQKFVSFVVVSYIGAIWSLYTCITTSYSFLDAICMITEGSHALICGNFVLLHIILLSRWFVRFLFGELRLIEYEHILERISYVVLHFIMTYSGATDGHILSLILNCALLVFCKTLHWILRDRMDFTFQATAIHTRISSLICSKYMLSLLIILTMDGLLSLYYLSFFKQSSSVTEGIILFSEHLIISAEMVKILLLTGLNFLEIYTIKQRSRSHRIVEPVENDGIGQGIDLDEEDEDNLIGIEGKFIYEKLFEIITNTLQILIKFVASFLLSRPMTTISAFWDTAMTFKSARVLWKSWKGSKSLDASLKDATDSQIENGMFDLCIVCMEDFVSSSERKNEGKKVKILPCGHALHLSCLKNWIARSPTCPICRIPIFDQAGNIVPYPADQSSTENNPANTDDSQERNNSMEVESDNTISNNTDEGITSTSHLTSPENITVATTRRSSLVLPVESSNENTHTFRIVTESGKQLEGSISLKNNMDLNQQSITVPQNLFEEQDASQLKRKVAELESMIEDLSKKVKRE